MISFEAGETEPFIITVQGEDRPGVLYGITEILAERTGVDDLKKLVAVLIQADRFGTSIVESLRTHSDFMRIRRRQDHAFRRGDSTLLGCRPVIYNGCVGRQMS